jgi:hypothetical protein
MDGSLKQPEGQQRRLHAHKALAQDLRGREPMGALALLEGRLRLGEADLERDNPGSQRSLPEGCSGRSHAMAVRTTEY